MLPLFFFIAWFTHTLKETGTCKAHNVIFPFLLFSRQASPPPDVNTRNKGRNLWLKEHSHIQQRSSVAIGAKAAISLQIYLNKFASALAVNACRPRQAESAHWCLVCLERF